jgi:vacuolar-type H+-ATPase subunit C/Vma6
LEALLFVLRVGFIFSKLLLFCNKEKIMAKVFIDEAQQKQMIDQYNAETAFRSKAYWDSVEKENPIVQGFRYIAKTYEISFEKQERIGKQNETYRLCVKKRKQSRDDL